MSSNLPHFIQEHLVFISDIHLSRRHCSTIALLRNLQLYEIQRKQILNSIDLQDTVLKSVHQRLKTISPVLDATQNEENEVLGSSIRCSSFASDELSLGKYVYQNRNLKIVYLILKCWNSLVIVRKDTEGFTLEEEYECVKSFEITKGSQYETQLTISFLDSDQNLITNLQKKTSTSTKPNTGYRRGEGIIKMKQSELLVHKTITKKEFSKLRNLNVFGSNYIRTPQLDEMRILSKCSDAWLKVNADDKVVVGVPLVNNCSSRLITLENLRGVLQCSGKGDLNYTFALYQQSTFCETENVNNFLESESNHIFDWSQCAKMSLRPECFYVLIFKLNIQELVEFNALDLLLFLSFDVTLAERIFPQKSFLTRVSFREIFSSNVYKISFQPNHIHRDLLSVISTSHKLKVLLKYDRNDASLKEYLCNGMDFHIVSLPEIQSVPMNVDGCDEEQGELESQSMFFYNNNPASLWHGTLIAITKAAEDCSAVNIFTKTQEKSAVILRFLELELRVKCGIRDVSRDCDDLCVKLVQFEGLLRDECKSYLELLSSKREAQEPHRDVFLMELKTDLWLKKMNSLSTNS